jgi:hypothetical protein
VSLPARGSGLRNADYGKLVVWNSREDILDAGGGQAGINRLAHGIFIPTGRSTHPDR